MATGVDAWRPSPAKLPLFLSNKGTAFPRDVEWAEVGVGRVWMSGGAGCGEQEGMERGPLCCVSILHAPPPPSGPRAWTRHLLFTILAKPRSGLTCTHTCRDTVGDA